MVFFLLLALMTPQAYRDDFDKLPWVPAENGQVLIPHERFYQYDRKDNPMGYIILLLIALIGAGAVVAHHVDHSDDTMYVCHDIF